MTDFDEFAVEYLPVLRERLRLSSGEEDKLLTSTLKSSAMAIVTLTGASNLDISVAELAIERSIYVYNDALDEFKKAYSDEIEDLYLRYMVLADEEES